MISIIPLPPKAKVAKKDFQGKNAQKQKERKDFFPKDIKSLFGGLTNVKSSGPFNSKGKKITLTEENKNVYFFNFRLTELHRVALQGEVALEKECNLEFRKCRIKE